MTLVPLFLYSLYSKCSVPFWSRSINLNLTKALRTFAFRRKVSGPAAFGSTGGFTDRAVAGGVGTLNFLTPVNALSHFQSRPITSASRPAPLIKFIVLPTPCLLRGMSLAKIRHTFVDRALEDRRSRSFSRIESGVNHGYQKAKPQTRPEVLAQSQ